MFGWFKKKKESEVKRPVRVLKNRQELMEVGKATLRVYFEDGRSFKFVIYGEFQQGVDFVNQFAYDGGIRSASDGTQYHISSLGSVTRTFVDDQKTPTRSVVGNPRSIKLITTDSHKDIFTVHYMEIQDAETA